MTPSHIGRYEIQRRLGRGGMGSLYLGYDPKLKRPVAIKLLNEDVRDNHELRERFAREAESVARLRHPNIVVVFDVGEDETGQPFMAMEYIAGDTLKHILEPPSIPLPKRLSMIEDLCAGLAHAHAAEIVHRDIKPENIMIDGDGVVKILDFGIARQANSGMTQDGMMLGTYNYMSPEQMMGSPVDHRSDIFAVGAVLYEVIALRKAFPGAFPEAYHRILTAGPVPLETVVPGVDPELAKVVYRALDRKPERRYQHVSALRQDLMTVRRRLGAPVQESGERTAYERTRVARSKTERPDARRQADSKRLAEVRRQQVEEHLRLAHAASERGDHAAVLQHAERAASVDPDSRDAFDLIDKARLALDTSAVLKLLREASQLHAEGRLDEAASVAAQASSTVPEGPGTEGLGQEVQHVVDAIRDAMDREGRIQTSLHRVRDLLDKGSFETALRAVYEVLALDPDRTEARDLEQNAKDGLNALRERERQTREAYDRLKSARALADEGKFDDALRTIADVTPTSITVRHAAEEAIADVRRLQHEAAIKAAVSAAEAALSSGDPERAIAGINAIAASDQSDHSRQVRAAAVAELERRREIARRKHALEDALTAARALVAEGDLARAQIRVDQAAALELDDERLHALRREIAQLRVEAKRREQERLAREEAERRAREEADRRAREEEARRAREEAERRAREEAEQRAREEAEQRAREQADRRAREEAERRAREEADRRAREEAERHAREESERREREEALRRKQEEEHRREEERRKQEEVRRQEEARRKQQEERERQEADAKKRAELEAARKREEQRLEEERRAEAERRRLDAERQRKEEERRAEERRRIEAEQKAKAEAEAEQKARAEADRRRREDEGRRRREEEERRRREEDERAVTEADVTQIVTQVRGRAPVAEDAATIIRPFEEELPAVPEIRTPPPAPRPVPPSERPASKLPIAAAAAVVVLALGAGAYYLLTPETTVVQKPVTTTIPAVTTIDQAVTTTVPVPSSQPLGTLRVDALPWATVTIRALSQGVQLETTEYVTPFTAALPSGDYELRFSNPQYRAPDVTKVKVTADRFVDVQVMMRGFDPDKALDSILGAPGR